MKSSLSKTLVFGVIATSFALINCQKPPSRGIKAKGAAGAPASNKTQQDVNKLQACPASLNGALTSVRAIENQIMNLFKIDGLNDSQKTQLNQLAEQLNQKCEDAKKVLADSKTIECKTTQSDQSVVITSASTISKECNGWGQAVENKTQVSNTLSDKADDAVKEAVNESAREIEETRLFEVSKDLGELLDSKDKSESTFVAGQPFNSETAFSAAILQGHSACKITNKGAKLAEGSLLKVLDVKTISTVSGATQLDLKLASVNKSESSSVYGITCEVLKKDSSDVMKAMLAAFGDHFKVSTKTETTTSATRASTPTTETSSTATTTATRTESSAAAMTTAAIVATAEATAPTDTSEISSPSHSTTVAVSEPITTSASSDGASTVITTTASTAAAATVEQAANQDLLRAQEQLALQAQKEAEAKEKVAKAQEAAVRAHVVQEHAKKAIAYSEEAARQAQIAKDKAKEAAYYRDEVVRINESEAKTNFRKQELKEQYSKPNFNKSFFQAVKEFVTGS